jgi:hypothetical protein
MPKKSANARGNAQRNRPKLQKSIQLVRPVSATTENESEAGEEMEGTSAVATSTAPTLVAEVEETTEEVVSAPARVSNRRASRRLDTSAKSVDTPTPASPTPASPAASRSASERLAARRQQQTPQKTRQAVGLVTAEHYAYVRRDLIFIAILAILMFGTLVVLHFVPAIGG